MTPQDDYFPILRRIDDCYRAVTGSLLPCPPHIEDRYQWLHENAPYGLVAHNTEENPRFIYANRQALSVFKYTPKEMFSLPSSATTTDAQSKEKRERLLQAVKRDGIAHNYFGPRLDKYGEHFFIYDGTVWQLHSEDGTVWGQAAYLWV